MGPSGPKKRKRASQGKASRLSKETPREDIWAQCEICNKWRRLRPGSVVQEDAPWYCTMNTDKQRNRCDIDEEDYPEDECYVDDVTEGSTRSQGKPSTSAECNSHRDSGKPPSNRDRGKRGGTAAGAAQKHPRRLGPTILGQHQKTLSQGLATAATSQHGAPAAAPPPTPKFPLDMWRSMQAIAPRAAVVAMTAANAASASNYFRSEVPEGAAVAKDREELSWAAALASTAVAKGLVTRFLNDARPVQSTSDAPKPPLPPSAGAMSAAVAAEKIRLQEQAASAAAVAAAAAAQGGMQQPEAAEGSTGSHSGNGVVATEPPVPQQQPASLPVADAPIAGSVHPQRPGMGKPPLPPSAPGTTGPGTTGP